MTDQNPSEQPAGPPQPGPFTWSAPGGAPWSGPGAWQLPPVAPRPGRGRTTAAWSIVVVAAALIAGAVGYEIGLQHGRIGSVVQGFQAATNGPCPAGETAPKPGTTAAAGSALLARLLPMPPGDSPMTGEPLGVLSLRDYVSALYNNDPGEQQRLSARCFQTAVHREWSSPGGTLTSVWLIEFATAAGARSYILSMEQSGTDDSAYTDVFRVSHVADGMCFVNPKLDKYGNTRTNAVGDVGNVAIMIHFYVPARTDNAAIASILRQQSSLLSSGSP